MTVEIKPSRPTGEHCVLRRFAHDLCDDPVHQHADDGSWWFCDETWAHEHGPYLSEDEAREGCMLYARFLELGCGV